MSTPDAPQVVFHPPPAQTRITVSLADILEQVAAGGGQVDADAGDTGPNRIAELASQLLAELRREGR